jgi:hypothetical protein
MIKKIHNFAVARDNVYLAERHLICFIKEHDQWHYSDSMQWVMMRMRHLMFSFDTVLKMAGRGYNASQKEKT